ncbi:MAG: hypothetical protein RIS44_637 [Pseudomonadota bacterium]|jgi:hypothetical protein
MSRFGPVLLTVALCALSALPAMAQWKWKDANGSVQYSDSPPPSNVKEADILQRPNAARRASVPATSAAPAPAASAPATSAAPKVDKELEDRKKKQDELEAAKKKEIEQKNAAARKENCTQARNYMKSLEDGMRISRTTSTGEREILDDTGRAAEVKRTQAIIKSDCK